MPGKGACGFPLTRARAPSMDKDKRVMPVRRQHSVVNSYVTVTQSHQGSLVTVQKTHTTVAPPSTPTGHPQSQHNKENNDTPAGPVAGGVVGGVVGLALLLAISYFIWRRVRSRRDTRKLDEVFAEAGVGGGGIDRRMRTRGNQLPLEGNEHWSGDPMPIHMEEDFAHAPLAVPSDPAHTEFASPMHVRPTQEPLVGERQPGMKNSYSAIPAWNSQATMPASHTYAWNEVEGDAPWAHDFSPMAARSVSSEVDGLGLETPVHTQHAASMSQTVEPSPIISTAQPFDEPLHSSTTSQLAPPVSVRPTAPPTYIPPTPSMNVAPSDQPVTPAETERSRTLRVDTNVGGASTGNNASPSSAYMWLPRRIFNDANGIQAQPTTDTAGAAPHTD